MQRKTRAHYLAELRRIAGARGGAVLSPAYVDDTAKLRFRCAEGHEWQASPGKIKQGRWCPECGRNRGAAQRKAKTAVRLARLAERRRGTIISPSYVNSQTKLCFRCAEGHEWAAVPASVLMGTWCRECAIHRRQVERKERVMRRLRRRVQARGGRVLSPQFVSALTPLLVRCARGHEWHAAPSSIDQGVWCATCKEDSWLALVQERAAERGGVCTSTLCRRGGDPVLLACAQGHRWTTTAILIKRGAWCPRCHLARPLGLERMREVARERGGECLSARYLDASSKLRWRCAEGHEWRASGQAIVRGSWCRVCRRGQGKSRRRLTIAIMRDIARERGGSCLSERYGGIYGRLRWRCAQGHEWVTQANNVRRGGWCPECSGSVLGTLERMKSLAAERGGRCLTRRWNDHRQPLLFECDAGHRFRQFSNVVKSGVWCPRCPRNRRRASRAKGNRQGTQPRAP